MFPGNVTIFLQLLNDINIFALATLRNISLYFTNILLPLLPSLPSLLPSTFNLCISLHHLFSLLSSFPLVPRFHLYPSLPLAPFFFSFSAFYSPESFRRPFHHCGRRSQRFHLVQRRLPHVGDVFCGV